MSLVDLLLSMYELTLRGLHLGGYPSGWLGERQILIDRLVQARPPDAIEQAVARVLLAGILHADEQVRSQLFVERRRLQGLRRRSPYFQ